jgi:hypothetical protein
LVTELVQLAATQAPKRQPALDKRREAVRDEEQPGNHERSASRVGHPINHDEQRRTRRCVVHSRNVARKISG